MANWLAVVTEENCRVLATIRYPFYALPHRVATAAGDRCILYRSGKHGGFVGEFEFLGEPEKTPVKVGYRSFPYRMPWKIVVLRDDDPVKIGPLVQTLNFIKNKQFYGMALRSAIRELGHTDYEQLAELLSETRSQVDASQPAVISKGQSLP